MSSTDRSNLLCQYSTSLRDKPLYRLSLNETSWLDAALRLIRTFVEAEWLFTVPHRLLKHTGGLPTGGRIPTDDAADVQDEISWGCSLSF